ncbi:hypothetical protein MASR2M29_21230 [Spirochaetota bacterium]
MQNKTRQDIKFPDPTPEQELERYGVWVKSEPQDILDELVPEEIAEEPSFEQKIEAASLSDDSDIFDTVESLPSPEEETSISLDFDFLDDLPELEIGQDKAAAESKTAKSHEVISDDILEDSVFDVDLDDLEPFKEEIHVKEEKTNTPERNKDSFAATEISIEEFGMVNESESESNFNTAVNLEDSLEIAKDKQDFEKLDIDLSFEDSISQADAIAPIENDLDTELLQESGDDFESIDLDAFDDVTLPQPASVTATETSIEAGDSLDDSLDPFFDQADEPKESVIPSLEIEDVAIDSADESKTDSVIPGKAAFDDVKALEDDLSEARTQASSDLLLKIASELASIKDELVSLRSQLSSLKTAAPANAEEQEETVQADDIEEPSGGGFFDDEEDDTIALTGDELDNILNSADFTEEFADQTLDETVEELGGNLPEDSYAETEIQDDLLPEDGNYEAGIETIDLPTYETSEKEAEAMSEVLVPITDAPEDTSFLDEEVSALDDFELDHIEEPPLIEPDPSDLGIIIDSTFGPEDEEALPVIEAADDDLETPIAENLDSEIVLDIEAEDRTAATALDAVPEIIDEEELFELEDLPETEELGGMELHKENNETVEASYGPEASLDSLEDLEELAGLNSDADYAMDMPVPHPDDFASSLDDSLFVGADAIMENTQETEAILEDVDLDDIQEYVEDSLDLDLSAPEIADSKMPFESIPDFPVESHENDGLQDVSETTAQKEAVAMPAEDVSEPDETKESQPAAVAAPDDKPDKLKQDVKSVLLYLDQLLASLPEEKIEEFASSEYYDTYKKLFDELGLL